MTFRRVRLVRIEEWLVHYVPADDPDFQQIRDDVALEITRTRGIPRDEWERGAGTAAARRRGS